MSIFISYSNRDGDAVRTLAQDLERARHVVWLDQDLSGGDAWWRKILEQIRDCTVFVVGLSDNSLRSEPCRAELDYARRLGIPILPVQIGHVTSLRTVAISDIQVVDYRDRTASAGISLLGALSECSAHRGELPDPLPLAPPIPYEYLIKLGESVKAPQLSPGDQADVLGQLREKIETEDDESVRRDIAGLLKALRRRADVTYRSVGEIDELLVLASAAPPRTGWVPQAPQGSPAPGHAAPGPAQPAPNAPPAGGPYQWPPAAPVAPQPQYGAGLPPPGPTYAQPAPPGQAPAPGSGMSVTAIVLGVLSLIPVLFIITGPAGVIFAIVGLSRKERLGGVGLAVAIAGGVLGLVITAAIGAAAR